MAAMHGPYRFSGFGEQFPKRRNRCLGAILLFLWFAPWGVPAQANPDVSLLTQAGHWEADITRLALEDVQQLLATACRCPVSVNDTQATVIIALPEAVPGPLKTVTHFKDKERPYPYFFYPEHGYTWNTWQHAGRIRYELEASSLAGISNGLYGLLQETLGFAFYHPRETHVPDLTTWPNTEFTSWTAAPRFEKKGFHLHTQHPLELTEALMMLDEASWPRVREYIDWLARNQQNYFEFNLLEGIDRANWPLNARRMVDYLHSRGIIAGLDLSLHMMQQKSFMLYLNPPNSLRTKKRQIKRNTDLLFQADWDIWNVEFSTTEFTGGNVERKKTLQAYLNGLLIEKGAKLMGRAHVVQEEALLGSSGGPVDYYRGETDSLDACRGIMSHTVMFYTAAEEHAPVYGNENLRHMLELLLEEQRVRETWYYPESAYWITFDNSVPMLLLPYLQSRHDDILHMHELGVQGHLTFSSGWEWGYWLIDWSIARWSWAHERDGLAQPTSPTQYAADLPVSEAFPGFLAEANALHQAWLKDSNLIAYLTAQTVTDEMPGSLNLHLHPRPDWRYGWLMNDAPAEKVNEVRQTVVPALQAFEVAWQAVRRKHYTPGQEVPALELELRDALDMVALRARHRRYTLEALTTRRLASLGSMAEDFENPLTEAARVRTEAMEMVRRREAAYRYPVEELATQRWDHTAYHFGYLYTVHDLHFWSREEAQIRKNRWGPLFHNIWKIPRIIGLTD